MSQKENKTIKQTVLQNKKMSSLFPEVSCPFPIWVYLGSRCHSTATCRRWSHWFSGRAARHNGTRATQRPRCQLHRPCCFWSRASSCRVAWLRRRPCLWHGCQSSRRQRHSCLRRRLKRLGRRRWRPSRSCRTRPHWSGMSSPICSWLLGYLWAGT